MAADARLRHPRSAEDGLPRGGMVITATDDDVVCELVVRFGAGRAVATIRCRHDETLTLSARRGEPAR